MDNLCGKAEVKPDSFVYKLFFQERKEEISSLTYLKTHWKLYNNLSHRKKFYRDMDKLAYLT